MLELKAAAFYSTASSLKALQVLTRGGKRDATAQMKAKHKDFVIELLHSLQKHLDSLEANFTRLAVNRLLEDFGTNVTTYNDFERSVSELDQRLRDELRSKLVFVIESEKTKYLLPPEQVVGSDISTAIPSSLYELDEAAKCLAFSRPTAAVFHLMRTMEIGIKAIARCLKIPDPTKPAERNWGKILQTINDAVETKSTWSRPEDKAFFEGVYVTLDAVRNPWRNATMHVETKYTEEEAEYIFTAVRAFMMKIASRLDEQGQPNA